MTLADWGVLPAASVAPLYRREEDRWRAALAWDTSTTWQTIESARQGWGLPGLVCRDHDGVIRGWTFFMQKSDGVEVGGIVADAVETTGALLDGILERAAAVAGFVYASAPGLDEALTRRGVSFERHAYLTRPTSDIEYEHPHISLRAWRADDLEATAELLQEAYGPDGHLFARDNSPQQWRRYVEHLLAYAGCGVMRPDLSRVAVQAGRVAGLALVTSLAADTAHLAQLAVSRRARRSGLANALLADALKAAHTSAHARMSLLVSRENAAAMALYSRWEFSERGEFLAFRRQVRQVGG